MTTKRPFTTFVIQSKSNKMDKQIHEVYTFFKEKIIAGEYTLVSVDSATATVEIHGHNFVIWIKNGAFGVSTYNGSFMDLSFSDPEKEKAWIYLKSIVQNHTFDPSKPIEVSQRNNEWMKLSENQSYVGKDKHGIHVILCESNEYPDEYEQFAQARNY